MLREVTRRRFMFQTLGMIGGTMVAGDLLPLLAEASQAQAGPAGRCGARF
jgi:hypothetical protein